jgi:hypothetical protein
MSSTDYSDPRFPAAGAGWRRSYSRISWGAVLAGAVVAAAAMLLLSFLGVAIGAGGLRLSQTSAADLKSYGLGAGIWTAINVILSMGFGGYVAARLSGTHSHLDGELHGITVWAVATLLASLLLAQLASLAVGTVTTGTAGNASLTGSLAQQVGPQALLDRLQLSLTANGDPTQMTREQIKSEIAGLTGRLVLNGTLAAQDHDQLVALTAAEANLTKEEAARRVAQIEQQATAALAQARAAADTAAASAALGAKGVFSALLLGLGAAMLGAWIGTRHARVVTPHLHEPAYDTHTTTYVTHHTAHDPAHEPAHVPAATHHYADTPPLPASLHDIAFPATKQDLLRAARARGDDPQTIRRLEQLPDRTFATHSDLSSALLVNA